jgi:RNA polymerase sigma-70 factor (ECF subfamily)
LLAPQLDALYRTARRMTRNVDDAEDLVQDTAVRAFRAFAQFQKGTNFRAWIFRVLTTTFINRQRAMGRQPVIESVDEEHAAGVYDHIADEAPTPEAAVLERLSVEDIIGAMDSLPQDFAAAVQMADVEGMDYQEVADALGIPLGTVRSRLHRGRRLLRSALSHMVAPEVTE